MHDRSTGAVAEAPLSTTEALRRALEALGSDAQVNDIIDYAREHFGLDAGPEPGPAMAVPTAPPVQALARPTSTPAPADAGRKPPQPRRGKGRGPDS